MSGARCTVPLIPVNWRSADKGGDSTLCLDCQGAVSSLQGKGDGFPHSPSLLLVQLKKNLKLRSAKWDKSDRERQIPCDFTYMWNLKNNISKQNRNRLRGTKNRLMGADGRGVGGLCEKGEGIERYRLVVTEQSWGCKVQHREYSQ